MCEHVTMPGGGTAIVCGGHSRRQCPCGRRADLLCDWKVPTKRSGTCDAPLCSRCTTSPAEGKDLCAKHAAEFGEWRPTHRPPAEPQHDGAPT